MRNLTLMGGASVLALCLGMGPAVAHQTEILFAGQTEDVGDVTVSDDGTDLWIEIDLDAEGKILLSAKVAVSCEADEGLDGIPQTRKGNPIPGQFEAKESYDPLDESTSESIHIPLPENCDGEGGGENVNVAVHVTVGDIGEECLATTQTVSNPTNTQVVDVDGQSQPPANSVIQLDDPWSGFLAGNKPGNGAEYVWDTDGEGGHPPMTVDFQHIYSCPAGEFIVDAENGNQLNITCDDQFDAFLNGGLVGSDHAVDGWQTVHLLNLSGELLSPSNTLLIEAENVGGGPNPAMCIYEVDVTCSSCSDTAWADGEHFSSGRGGGGGPKRNWATYIEYITEGD